MVGGSSLPADQPGAVERGKAALTQRSYSPATMTMTAYENVWRQWGLAVRPAAGDYARLFRERYGMHPAPYANHDLPMGLKRVDMPLSFGQKGVSVDCLVCHGGSIAGQSYIGLGNASLDYQAFYDEMSAADGRKGKTPFHFCNVRGTNEAGAMAVFLLGYREPDLTLRPKRLDLDLQDDLCEDVPAWWLLKKKQTMYYTGGSDARSVRSLMQFMMSPLNFASDFDKAEDDFKDIREYLLSIQAPKYPLPIDQALASKGEQLFTATCSRCHGTYGEKWTYPNKFIPIEKIGTDRRRFDGITMKFGEYYNRSWFGKHYAVIAHDGYQAPPLDGVWATAPYFHNGSVPTIYHVLNSKMRPRIFTRSFRTDLDAYDSRRVGWKIEVLAHAPEPSTLPPIEYRRTYDTSQVGRGNTGHTFGDQLTEDERMAVLEYLKTL
jgi:mono/diheme cytochrome c family protein